MQLLSWFLVALGAAMIVAGIAKRRHGISWLIASGVASAGMSAVYLAHREQTPGGHAAITLFGLLGVFSPLLSREMRRIVTARFSKGQGGGR